MNLIEQLKIMSKTSYKDYEGDKFQIKLKEGLTKEEINSIRKKTPNGKLNADLEELLNYSKGFNIPRGFLGEINFDTFGEFGFEELIQFNLTITDDGAGNYWIQEINRQGEWGKIYYLCHDPPAMIKQAEDLSEFLIQLHEYLLKDEKSFFSKVINEVSRNVYFGKGRLIEQAEAVKSTDKLISEFASKYNDEWFIADLRNAQNGEGFRLEASYKETIRLGDELIWALKKHKSFWKRLKEKFQ